MRVVREAAELAAAVSSLKQGGREVGFVPTMGALHAGHLALIALAQRRGARVVASVFVNPTQFGPGEDFERYPRQPERDAGLLAEAGCDLLFLPERETIYPPGHATTVEVAGAARGLEAEARPGHFMSVIAPVPFTSILPGGAFSFSPFRGCTTKCT